MIPATCCTAESHARAKADPAQWAAMTPNGSMQVEADELGPAYELVMKNCHCGSTLAVEVAK